MENGKNLPTPYSIKEIQDMAANLVESKLFPGVDTKEKAFTLMMMCQAEGMHPMTVLRRFDMIEGRPAMKAAAMQAEFQQAGGRIVFQKRDRECCQATFKHPYGEITITVSIQEMHQSGITKGRQGQVKANWSRHPRQMLHARCVSEGIRTLCPEIVTGMHTSEEMRDIVDEDAGNVPETEMIPQVEKEKTETTPEQKQAKALRAAMGQEFHGCDTAECVFKIYKKYTRVHGEGVWKEFTHHKEGETFQDIYSDHFKRAVDLDERHTPEAHQEWIKGVQEADEKAFRQYCAGYSQDPRFEADDLCWAAIRDRAIELNIWNDANQELIPLEPDSKES